MPGTPTLAQVRAYIGVSVQAVSDEDLERMRQTAIDAQVKRCRDTEDSAALPDPLAQALLRRVQRQVAAKAIPLGLTGPEQGEYGPTRIPFFDSEIEDHERDYRRVVVG